MESKKRETCFDDVPKYVKEASVPNNSLFNLFSLILFQKNQEILAFIKDPKEVAKLREVNKNWKKLIDNSKKFEIISEERDRYEMRKYETRKFKDLNDLIAISKENDSIKCSYCVGEISPCVVIGSACICFFCTQIKTKRIFYSRFACFFSSISNFLIYLCCCLPLGLIALLFGSLIELFRALAWVISFRYCCLKDRKQFKKISFHLYTPSLEKEEVDCCVACAGLFFGINLEANLCKWYNAHCCRGCDNLLDICCCFARNASETICYQYNCGIGFDFRETEYQNPFVRDFDDI